MQIAHLTRPVLPKNALIHANELLVEAELNAKPSNTEQFAIALEVCRAIRLYLVKRSGVSQMMTAQAMKSVISCQVREPEKNVNLYVYLGHVLREQAVRP